MTQALHAESVPTQIADALNRLVWRARTVIAFRGVAATAATALIALLLIMAVDRLVVYVTDWPRYLMLLSALVATGVVTFVMLLHPLGKTFTMAGVARLLEQRHPEFQERISSAVELLTSTDGPSIRGSQVLIDALAAEAVVDAASITPRQEVSFRAARNFLMTAAMAISVLGGLFVIWPQATWQQLCRSLIPSSNIASVSSDELNVTVITGDTVKPDLSGEFSYVMLRGSRLQVQAEINRNDVGEAAIYLDADGLMQTRPMDRLTSSDDTWSRFEFITAEMDQDFAFKVHAGTVSQEYTVHVTDRPEIVDIRLHTEFPAYASLKATNVTLKKDKTPWVVAGSTVTVTSALNKPAVKADASVDDKPVVVTNDGESLYSFTILLDEVGNRQWKLQAIDRYGFTSLPQTRIIEARPDRKPSVTITIPLLDKLDATVDKKKQTTTIRLKPGDRLPFNYTVNDDLGLGSAAVEISVDGRPVEPRALNIKLPTRRTKGVEAIDLARPQYAAAKSVTFYVSAFDTLPGRIEPGQSKTYTIILDAKAKARVDTIAANEERSIREELTRILAHLRAAKSHSDALVKRLPAVTGLADTLDKGVRQRVGGLASNLGKARKSTEHLSKRLKKEGTYERMSRDLAALAKGEIARATGASVQVGVTDESASRVTHAKTADREVDRAIKIVQDMLGQLHEMVEMVRQVREFNELADRQAELAERADEAETGDQAETRDEQADRLADQEQVAEDLADIAAETPDAMKEMLKQQQAEADSLAEKARDLAEEQKWIEDTARKLEDPNADVEAVKGEIIAKIAADQDEIAQDTGDLENDVAAGQDPGDASQDDPAGGEKTPAVGQAAESTRETAEDLQQADLAEAAKDARKAVGDLQQAEKQLAGDPQAGEQGDPQAGEQGDPQAGEQGDPQAGEQGDPQAGEQGDPQAGEQGDPQAGEQGDPQAGEQGEPQAGEQGEPQAGEQGDPQAAAEAGELAGRQESVADQIDAVERGDLAAALAKRQADVAAQAADLAKQGEQLAQQGENLGLDKGVQDSGQTAAEQLARADQQADQAAQDMTGGQQGETAAGDQGDPPTPPDAGQQGEATAGEPTDGGQQGEPQAAGQGEQSEGGQPQDGAEAAGEPGAEPGDPAAGEPGQGESPGEGQGEGQGEAQAQGEGQGESQGEAQAQSESEGQGQGESQGEGQGEGQGEAQAAGEPGGQPSPGSGGQPGTPAEGQGGTPQAGEATDAMAQAADAMNKAADALEGLGKAAGDAQEAIAGGGEPGQSLVSGDAMAGAMSDTAAAAASGMASDAQAAAESMADLAAAAQAAAASQGVAPGAAMAATPGQGQGQPGQGQGQPGQGQAQGQSPGQSATPGQPSEGSPVGKGFGDGNLSAMDAEGNPNGTVVWRGLKGDWTQLKRNLDDKVLQGKGYSAPEEYRELVKRYFAARAKAKADAEKD